MPKKEKKEKGKKKSVEDEVAAVEVEPLPWTCGECDYENEDEIEECESCGAARPVVEPAPEQDTPYAGYKVGVVLSTEAVPKKDKLLLLSVDVGNEEPLPIVTNAPNVSEGSRVVVATVGSKVGEEEVKRAIVGGVASVGMLCDNPMLGWTGGGAGVAALVPESFAVGATPPTSRPRMDGK